MKLRILNILVALDIFLFTLACLGHTKRNETASSAAWSLELDGKLAGRVFRPLIDCVAAWLDDPDHCRKSFEDEQQRKQ